MMLNSANYSGLVHIALTSASIWKPNIIILNSVSTQKTLTNTGDDKQCVTVNHDGFIEWWLYINLQTQCKVQLRCHPFKTQICDISKSCLDDKFEIFRSVDDSFTIDSIEPNCEWYVDLFKFSSRNVGFAIGEQNDTWKPILNLEFLDAID